MPRRPFLLAALLALTAAAAHAATAFAQEPVPITPSAPPPTGLPIHQTFLTSADGWVAFGDGAKVSPVPNPLTINSANGALQLDYTIGVGGISAFLLPVVPGALAKAQSFQFDIRCDYAAKLVCGVQEREGGRYFANFSVPKDKWQHVELSASDFGLASNPTDPKDPDGKLDLDQVENIGLIDAGSLFAQANNPTLNELFGIPTGAHHLYLANFDVSAVPLPGASGVPATPGVLDTFAHPQVGWYTVGGVQAKSVRGAPLSGRGMSLDYTQEPGKVAGAIRFFPHGKLTGTTKLTLAVASVKAATLLVQVEDGAGDKFNTQVYVPAGANKTEAVRVAFADFKIADDSKNKAATLDLAQIDRLLIVDLSGAMGIVTASTPNTLYVGDLRATYP